MSRRFIYGFNLLWLVMLLSAIGAWAQQRPYYTQYILNPYVSNPALAGLENYWDVKLCYGNQWSGVAGAPQTLYVTAQGSLNSMIEGSKTAPTSRAHSKKTQARKSYNHKALLPHSGLGFNLAIDRAGPIDIMTFNSAYAYHFNLTSQISLSAGVNIGLQTIYLRTSELDFGTTNPIDPAATSSTNANSIKPDMSVGIWAYSRVYFVGIAAQNIIPANVAYANDGAYSGQMVAHTSVIAGYKFQVNEHINFIPSVMFKYVHQTPFNFDVNVKWQYENIGWLGISYRHNQSFAAMLGLTINSKLNVGYSYDFFSSRMKKMNNAGHEIVVGLLIKKRSNVAVSPRNFW